MKALSIRQPWAWAIIHGGKDVENRSWRYIPKQRGRIYIHAAKGMTRDEYDAAKASIEVIWEHADADHALMVPWYEKMERGGIIGTAEIIGYLDNDDAKQKSFPWYFGNLGIVLHDPKPLPFVPCKGMLGFFTPEIQP